MFLPPTHRCMHARPHTRTHVHTPSQTSEQLYFLRMLVMFVIIIYLPRQVLRPIRTRGPGPLLCPAQNQHSRCSGHPPSGPQPQALPPARRPLQYLHVRQAEGVGSLTRRGGGWGGAGKQQVQSSSSSGCPAGFKVGSYNYILNIKHQLQ